MNNAQMNKTLIVSNSTRTWPAPSSVGGGNNLKFIRRSRNNNVTHGMRKTSNNAKLKSADRIMEMYIGRCDENITSDDLNRYLNDDLKLKPRKIVQLETRVPYSSAFKAVISFADKEKMLDPQSWPEGVICRRYFTKRS